MKERPILFSGEMIRAILDGRKTQTRRVMKPQPTSIDHKTHTEIPYNGSAEFLMSKLKCPYGNVGDRLWVRETLIPVEETACNGSPRGSWLYYAADRSPVAGNHVGIGTVPSIFMPRWASRITLEITDVRVERLQDISEADAKAEGVLHHHAITSSKDTDKWARRSRQIDPAARVANARGAFSVLWDKINGKGHPWESNPWVWVVEFKCVEVKK